MSDPQARTAIIQQLPKDVTCTQKELSELIMISDKDQFVQYCNGLMTFNQFKRSVFNWRYKIKYAVLDDIKLEGAVTGQALTALKPKLKMIYGDNPTVKQILSKEFQPHELSFKCLKSVTYQSQQQKPLPSYYFKSNGKKSQSVQRVYQEIPQPL